MKTKSSLIFVSFLVLLILVNPVSAQDGAPEGPRYVVQPGDTLSNVADRFGLEINALISANQIANPNQVFAGTVLVLPGVDWVTGLIDTYTLPVGETLRSVKRRYHIDLETLARLGGVVSSSQVYAGYPLLVASDGSEDFQSARRVVNQQTSLLEIAAETGGNPWAIAARNQLVNPQYPLPGDVLLLPGTNDPGPGALPSPLSIQIRRGNFIQGKTTVIEISAAGQSLQLNGLLIDKPLTFIDTSAGKYTALQGVPALTPPGPQPLVIRGQLADGTQFELAQMIGVQDGGYSSEKISVDPAMLDPKLDAAELEYVALVTTPVTPEKMWAGLFVYPSQLEFFINSHYGTRRSYNGSAYNYFHSGTDLGGGEGTEVLASARGMVVFTGQLQIRGNATIIDHGWGIYTGYWHQSEIVVNIGDIVESGQVIGRVGNTGRSSGAHLHWEVWAGGVQVEPIDWLNFPFP